MEEVIGHSTFEELVKKTEVIVSELDSNIRQEGVNYSSNNESNATARALLWAGWMSWMWTSKSERKEKPDSQAKRIRPIVENLIQQFIETGRKIGNDGGTPETFLNQKL
jgi:hypothetical protein